MSSLPIGKEAAIRPFNINVLSGVLTRQHKITIPLLALLLPPLALAQIIPGTKGYEFVQTVDSIPQTRLGSNVIVDIQADPLDSSVWFSTGNGISNFDPPPDSLWRTWNESNGIGKGGVSASEVTDTVIWLATAYDTTVGISGAGGGLSFSRDHGTTWTHIPQPVDPHVPVDETGFSDSLGYWPTTTNVDNITYDMALSPNYIWITSKRRRAAPSSLRSGIHSIQLGSDYS